MTATSTASGRQPAAHTALIAFLGALFLLSGVSALIYQVLWLRLLGLVFGVTVYAASTVWAVFMAGLAIGSVTGGRLADRVHRPIVWFGVAEALIGITALLTPGALELLQRAYGAVHPSLDSSLTSLTLVRLGLSFVVLIVPSALMGATLPLIVKSSLLRAEGMGGRVGVLYGTNTAGAIVGSLLAGLVLIPRLGVAASFAVAVTLNLVVAAAAVIVGRRWRASGAYDEPVALERSDPRPAPALPAAARRRLMVVLAVFTLSGFVSLALEVVWFRVLTLFLRPTVYAYALMLAAVLAGIAAGSYAAAPWLRRRPERDWLLPLAWLEGGIAVTALLSFAVLPHIPALMGAAGPWVSALTGDYLAYQTVISVSVIVPAMFLFGLAFPIGLQTWASPDARGGPRVASRIGIFYSLNVAGAIAGSLAAGFVLLPWLGSRTTLLALAALALGSAFALLAAATRPVAVRLVAAGIMAAAFAGAVRMTPDPFDAFLEQRYRGQKILWQREGIQGTVSVHESGAGLSLHVNGNHQASTLPGMAEAHQRIGHLPMAVHRDARRALVIGLGGGATAGAVSQHAGAHVDIVELSPEVAQAAGRFFRAINFDVLRKPNARLMVDDGRNYLLLTDRRYDVVTADVILPIHAGSGNLYSVEYFQLVRRALQPGGMVLQWVAGTEAEYKLIMRTFLSVFPETTLWFDGSLMLGSVEPLRLRAADFEWKLQVPGRREALGALGLRSFADLLGAYRAGPDELRAYVGSGPLLSDNRPLVEYFLALPRDRQPDLSGVRGDVQRHVEAGVRP
jgi:spermidine synthase